VPAPASLLVRVSQNPTLLNSFVASVRRRGRLPARRTAEARPPHDPLQGRVPRTQHHRHDLPDHRQLV